jgi:hypothetical protein
MQYGSYVAIPTKSTNGLAVASMVLGIVWIYWIGSILAVIFGAVALKQMKARGQSGRGMATAGLILGIVGLITLLIVIVIIVASTTTTTTG